MAQLGAIPRRPDEPPLPVTPPRKICPEAHPLGHRMGVAIPAAQAPRIGTVLAQGGVSSHRPPPRFRSPSRDLRRLPLRRRQVHQQRQVHRHSHRHRPPDHDRRAVGGILQALGRKVGIPLGHLRVTVAKHLLNAK